MKRKLWMRSGPPLFLAMIFIALSSAGAGEGPREAAGHRTRVERGVMVEMRDGVKLATNIYFPEGLDKAPVILERTPYGKEQSLLLDTVMGRPNIGRELARAGYIFVHQDCRGRFDSEGVYYPFLAEERDGKDTIAWIKSQPWFGGKLGTFGSSYTGMTQWLESTGVRIDAMHLGVTSPRITEVMYRGGELQLMTAYFWATLVGNRKSDMKAVFKVGLQDRLVRTLPLERADDRMSRDVNYFNDFLDFEKFCRLNAPIDFTGRYGEVSAPAVFVAGWYDMFLGAQLEDFNRLIEDGGGEAGRSVLIVGPWAHGMKGGDGTVDFGPSGDLHNAVGGEHLLAWYGYWLMGEATGVEDWPRARIFVMGDNVWRNEKEWPLERAVATRYYFHSGGRANTRGGDGVLSTEPPVAEPVDTFVYDPLDPVPTLGGANLGFNLGAYDQSKVEDRADVLCYTTPALEADVEVTGPIEVVLWAATDAVDTDFTAKLVDVYPDGTPVNIQDGVVRAKYRHNDPARPTPLTPGRAEEYVIDLWATSNVFKKGHRVRVEISSSNFPRFNRNLNTGEPVPVATRAVIANQTVYHDADHPSHIVLPVVPRR